MQHVTGDTLVLSASVNGAKVDAIVDTGSGATIISASLATRLGIPIGERRTIRGLSGTTEINLAVDVDLAIGSERRRLPFVVVTNLDLFSAGLGRSVDLLLGADMLGHYALALDFDRRLLALAPTGTFEGGASWRTLALSLGSYRELLTTAVIADAPATLMVDLGSTAALMLSHVFVETHGLTKDIRTSTAALGGVEGVKTVSVFRLDRLTLAGWSVRSVPAIIPASWMSESSVGNLGLPILRQFNVVVDIAARQLWLRPAVRPAEILIDRSGLGVAIGQGELTIIHVARGSPAEKDGWVAGERIVAIGGEPIDAGFASGPLFRWRHQAAGAIVVLRDGTGRVRRLRLDDYF